MAPGAAAGEAGLTDDAERKVTAMLEPPGRWIIDLGSKVLVTVDGSDLEGVAQAVVVAVGQALGEDA